MPQPTPRVDEPIVRTAGGDGPAYHATLDHLLVEAAIQCPEADAILGDFGTLCYADLLIRAQNIAVVLKRRGIGPGSHVGIAIEPSPAMITAMVGVIFAGAAYVPLPDQVRSAAMIAALKQHAVEVILCDSSESSADSNSRLAFWKTAGTVLDVARMEQETMPSSDDMAMSQQNCSVTAAVLVTPGIGGSVTAVPASHNRIAHVCAQGLTPLSFGAGDTFLIHALPKVRDNLFEVWSSLLHGASIAIAPAGLLEPEAFAAWVRRVGVSVLCLKAPSVQMFLDQAPAVFSRLRHLIIENDGRNGAVSPMRVESLQRDHPNLRIVHTFSTPGIAGYATIHPMPWRYAAQADLPIGRPYEDLTASLLDRHAQPVRMGEIGELAFSLRDDAAGAVVMTGERARLRADGLLELHGHADPPRVPLTGPETQSALEAPALVPGKTTLHAGGEGIGTSPLRKKENEPMLSGEKYQQRTLDHVRALWMRLLRRDSIGYEEEFQAAGGTQVQLIRLHAELNRTYPGAITMSQLAMLTTIRKIYEHLMMHAIRGKTDSLARRGA